MENARFWVYINGAHVKLTLEPGQSLTHTGGGDCDEGYSWDMDTWTHSGTEVVHDYTTESRDCDGRYSRAGASVAPIGSLAHRWNPYAKMWQPAWDQQTYSQRDHSAEESGY